MTILIDYDPGQSSEWEIMKFWYLTSLVIIKWFIMFDYCYRAFRIIVIAVYNYKYVLYYYTYYTLYMSTDAYTYIGV